jgi:hypothetical protein
MRKKKLENNDKHIAQWSGCGDYAIGARVKLIPYHKDDRPTTIRSTGQEVCVLEDARAGYYGWNYIDIEYAV